MREPFWELFESQVQTQNIENFLIPRYKHKILRTLWRSFGVLDTNTKYWELFGELFESQIKTQNIEKFLSPSYKHKILRALWRTFWVPYTNPNIENTSENFLSPRYKHKILRTRWRTFWVLDTNAPPAFFDRLRILKMHWSDIWVKLHCSIAFAANKLGFFPPQVGDI